jgi:hypothetical protein
MWEIVSVPKTRFSELASSLLKEVIFGDAYRDGDGVFKPNRIYSEYLRLEGVKMGSMHNSIQGSK